MSTELATIEPGGLTSPDALIEIGIQKLTGCKSDEERQEVHNWAEEGKRRAEYHGFPALARVFQWLKNEADYATVQSHPRSQGKRTDLELVTAAVTSSLPASRLSELRTVATVWEPLRGHILDDDVADLPERGEMLAEARQKEREERATQKDAELLTLTPSSDVELYHLPVSELHTVVEAGSVDVIFTDPPYPREYLPVWSDLAAFASHALKPSGVLVAMSGQSYLPEVMASLGTHLTYRWTMAYLMPGADTTIWPRKVKTRWKPVLVYGAAEEWLNMDVVHADTLQARTTVFTNGANKHRVWCGFWNSS